LEGEMSVVADDTDMSLPGVCVVANELATTTGALEVVGG
jgi:hypothetical protein